MFGIIVSGRLVSVETLFRSNILLLMFSPNYVVDVFIGNTVPVASIACKGKCLSYSQSYNLMHFLLVKQVQTDFQQVAERQFLMNIPNADNINHIVVFMTGQTPFPDDLGGAGKP